jgi:hypothetical protein
MSNKKLEEVDLEKMEEIGGGCSHMSSGSGLTGEGGYNKQAAQAWYNMLQGSQRNQALAFIQGITGRSPLGGHDPGRTAEDQHRRDRDPKLA